MSDIDAFFADFNSYKLTAPAPITSTGGKLKIRNELPLMSQSVANAIATVAWGLSGPSGQAKVQKTIERSVNRKFLPYVNAVSRGNKASMHHLYEWGSVGITSARLFDLVIPTSSRGRANFSMKVTYRPSTKLVPLTTAQATPNPFTGKVVKKQHRFYNKAMVMENGLTVVVRPKNTKYMAFDNPPGALQTKSGLTFSSKPITINYADKPNYHGLSNTLRSFFAGYGGNEVGKSLRVYGKNLKRAAERSSRNINVSIPSDSYAKAMGSKYSALVMPGA
jgi:hypothetical protein